MSETLLIRGARVLDLDGDVDQPPVREVLIRAGAIEAVICLLATRDGVMPPTINYEKPDPECDLDYIPNEARELAPRSVLVNAFAFGGTNGCLVLKAADG